MARVKNKIKIYKYFTFQEISLPTTYVLFYYIRLLRFVLKTEEMHVMWKILGSKSRIPRGFSYGYILVF